MWAAANGNSAAAKKLLDSGADVGARSNSASKGRSAYLAPTVKERAGQERGGNSDSQRAQRNRGAQRPADADQDVADRVAFLARSDQDGGGLTPLVFATRRGDIDTVVFCLKRERT
jgi:ankyrin repeat protein